MATVSSRAFSAIGMTGTTNNRITSDDRTADASAFKSRSRSSTVHGLLTVRRGGQFSKRLRRVAMLEEGILSLRACEGCKPELTICVLGTNVAGDANALCITLSYDPCMTWNDFPMVPGKSPMTTLQPYNANWTRIRLYAHSRQKFTLWLTALTQASVAMLGTFYKVTSVKTPEFPPTAADELPPAIVMRGTDRASGAAVAVKIVPLTFGSSGSSMPSSASASSLMSSAPPSPTSVLPRPSSFINTRSNSSNARSSVQSSPPCNALHAFAVAQARREARVCQHVRHNNLLYVHDLFVTPHAMHIVTDLHGHTLQCILNCYGRLCERVAARIIRDVLEGLEYLHAESVVHRAITPRNISIRCKKGQSLQEFREAVLNRRDDEGAVAVISDFGAAAFAPRRPPANGGGTGVGVREGSVVCDRVVIDGDGLCAGCALGEDMERETVQFTRVARGNGGDDGINTRFGGIDRQTVADGVGVQGFMAPEIEMGLLYGPPADIWSVGAMLTFMLCGRMPGDCGSGIAVEDGVSNRGRAFVNALLRPNARLRLTADAALGNEWLNLFAPRDDSRE